MATIDESFERQLKSLVGTPPTKIRIDYVGLDEPNYVLLEASFELDGVRLPLGEHVLHVKRNDLAFDTDAFEVTQAEPVSIKVERVGRRVRVMQGKTLLGHKESSKSDAVVGSPPPAAKAPFGAQQARAHLI